MNFPFLSRETSNRFSAIIRGDHFVPIILESHFDDFSNGCFIVDHHYHFAMALRKRCCTALLRLAFGAAFGGRQIDLKAGSLTEFRINGEKSIVAADNAGGGGEAEASALAD